MIAHAGRATKAFNLALMDGERLDDREVVGHLASFS